MRGINSLKVVDETDKLVLNSISEYGKGNLQLGSKYITITGDKIFFHFYNTHIPGAMQYRTGCDVGIDLPEGRSAGIIGDTGEKDLVILRLTKVRLK